jgi:hypothetical protein
VSDPTAAPPGRRWTTRPGRRTTPDTTDRDARRRPGSTTNHQVAAACGLLLLRKTSPPSQPCRSGTTTTLMAPLDPWVPEEPVRWPGRATRLDERVRDRMIQVAAPSRLLLWLDGRFSNRRQPGALTCSPPQLSRVNSTRPFKRVLSALPATASASADILTVTCADQRLLAMRLEPGLITLPITIAASIALLRPRTSTP